MHSFCKLLLTATVTLLALLSGCSLTHFDDISSASSLLPAISGTVHGGQQPVSGSTIQLYAASNTTLKGASTPLLLTTITTDANGYFNITGQYPCPTPASLVYITSTGGNPGLAGGTNNANIALMTALGTCGNLLLGGSNITIAINELTTVAAVEALSGFMADFTHVGANLANSPNALASAFANAASIVSTSTGNPINNGPGTSASVTQTIALYNTLANILASCINTSGNTGSTTNCYKLFSATSSSYTDTIAALLYVVQHPSANIATLFPLTSSTAPFQPSIATAPAEFTASLVINIPNTGEYRCCTDQRMAIDTSQQIWVGNQGTQGVHVYSNSGTLLYTLTLPYPLGEMASDPLGNVWFVTRQLFFPYVSITKYSSSGALLSPASGYQLDQGTTNQLYTYLAGSNALRFDSAGNFWITGSQGGTGKSCAMKFASTGTYLFSVCPSSISSNVPALAVDSSDNVYLAMGSALYKFSSLGVSQFTTPPSISSIDKTYYLHYDPVSDHIWLYDDNNVTIYASSGAVVKARFADSLHFSNPFGLDGAGNAIVSSSAYPVGITQFDPTGTIILPPGVNPGDFYVGYESYNALTTGVGRFEVDGLGNAWAVGGNNVLARVSGLAVPRAQLYR